MESDIEPPIIRLPFEIFCHILKQLEGHEIALCRIISRHFKQSIENSTLLQYAIKLAMCGYEDGPPASGPLSTTIERLQRLQAHIDAWRHLDWAEERITLPRARTSNLFGGIYASVGKANPFSLNFVELPSRVRGTLLRLWTFADVGFPINDFAIDPGQDLLILVELREEGPNRWQPYIHLRTLSENAPHPRASVSILSTERRATSPTGQSQIQVVGNKLGFAWDEREAEVLQVWRWDSGAMIFVRSLDPGTPSFCFLDENTILLPHFDGQLSEGGGAIAVYRLPSSDTPDRHYVDQKIELIATFELPALFKGVGSTIYVHNNTSMTHSNPDNPRPFHIPPGRRVVGIEWATIGRNESRGPDGINGLTLESSVFVRLHNVYVYPDVFRRDPDFHPSTPIPWHRWGPHNTRMFSHSIPRDGRTLFGPRNVHFWGSAIVVCDFTQAQAAWKEQWLYPEKNGFLESRAVGRLSPEELVGAHIYQDRAVRTYLPYFYVARQSPRVRGLYPHGIMYDDEHIVLRAGHDSGTGGHEAFPDDEVCILTM